MQIDLFSKNVKENKLTKIQQSQIRSITMKSPIVLTAFRLKKSVNHKLFMTKALAASTPNNSSLSISSIQDPGPYTNSRIIKKLRNILVSQLTNHLRIQRNSEIPNNNGENKTLNCFRNKITYNLNLSNFKNMKWYFTLNNYHRIKLNNNFHRSNRNIGKCQISRRGLSKTGI